MLIHYWASLVAQTIKNSPAMWETWVWSLTWEDPLEKEMATHSSILVWRIPWTEEPGGLQSMGSRRVGHNWATSLSLFNSEVLRNCVTQRFWKEFGINTGIYLYIINTDIYRYIFGINTDTNAAQEAIELDMEQWTGSKLGREYVKAAYCHPACLT